MGGVLFIIHILMKHWEGTINQRLSPYFLRLYPSNNLYLYPHTLYDFLYFVVILMYDKYLNTNCSPLQPAKATATSVWHNDKNNRQNDKPNISHMKPILNVLNHLIITTPPIIHLKPYNLGYSMARSYPMTQSPQTKHFVRVVCNQYMEYMYEIHIIYSIIFYE